MIKKSVLVGLFFLILIVNLYFVNAYKLEIKIDPVKEDNIKFKVFLYDDNGNNIDGLSSYLVNDYHINEVKRGMINSGEEVNFILPKNPVQGPWEIIAEYNGIKAKELFEVGDIKKADIKLEGDSLIIENTGNVPYDKNILIYIGEEHQTARVYLEVAQTKKIKLTAPTGSYTIQVSDGTEENNLVFNNVGLTGNVVSLERVTEGSFWKRNPLIILFFVTLTIIILIILGSRTYSHYHK